MYFLMAIDSRTISSSPVGIPVPTGGRPRQTDNQSQSPSMYGSSPPIRLPVFSSSPGDSPNLRPPTLPQSSGLSRAFGASPQVSIPIISKRSKRRNQTLVSDEMVVDEGILPVLSNSFFSTLSLDDFDLEDDYNGDGDERSSSDGSRLGSPRMSLTQSSGDIAFSRISRQGRKILKSERVPMEQILEFESMIFDHLSTKTPRHRLLQGAEYFFLVTIQNPFHRSLLHSVCQYYCLHSQSILSHCRSLSNFCSHQE